MFRKKCYALKKRKCTCYHPPSLFVQTGSTRINNDESLQPLITTATVNDVEVDDVHTCLKSQTQA